MSVYTSKVGRPMLRVPSRSVSLSGFTPSISPCAVPFDNNADHIDGFKTCIHFTLIGNVHSMNKEGTLYENCNDFDIIHSNEDIRTSL